jgi:hypothetical protein
LNDVEKETYAYLVGRYLLHYEAKRPRFVLIGFDEIRGQLHRELEKNKIQVIEPELTGRLKEASHLRGKTEESCVILIGRQNLGKFASLVTAFKVLEEVIDLEWAPHEDNTDLHDLIDVSKWLLDKGLDDVANFVQDRIVKLPSTTNNLGVKFILNDILKLAERKPSFSQWLHPRKISKALVIAVDEHRKGKPPTVSLFLRNLGIESTASLENIPLFQENISKRENLEALRTTLLGFSRVVKYYVASDVTSQRKNLADLCFNYLRTVIYELARAESSSASKGKWTRAFCDFESAFREKHKTTKKYRVEPRGVRIRKRSAVSGLPKRISVPLNVTLESEASTNLLKEFMADRLNEITREYSRLKEPNFSIKPLNMAKNAKEMVVEFSVIEKNGNIELDTYLDGLRSPASQINRLIALIERKG